MSAPRSITVSNECGDTLSVRLFLEGDREAGLVVIDGIPYHIERMRRETMMSRYRVDEDPDYGPRSDTQGFCVIIAPYAE